MRDALCIFYLVVGLLPGRVQAQSQSLPAQAQASAQLLSILTEQLPKALLWEPYRFQLRVSGGIEPYHWRVLARPLPRGFVLNPNGELDGTMEEPGQFGFIVMVSDSNNLPKQQSLDMALSTETPLSADWLHKAKVNGQRIDGSVKVSNNTGRDFDLTVIVLAVNDIGRATAIGYQHFPLKRDTRDMEIPFGETLSTGNYAVNVDVVGEEPISGRIFRSRLLTGKEAITQGP